jgi:DNA-binding MarR family transcriptional regulator
MPLLVQSDGVSLQELSTGLGLTDGAVSGIADRLQNRGMVKRELNESDQRLPKIVVSEREFLPDVWPRPEVTPFAQVLRAATPQEREVAVEGVKTVQLAGRAKGGQAQSLGVSSS